MKFVQQLENNEIERFSRQIILKEIGIEGQKKLRNKKVLIVGLGGLGSPVAAYLAGSGIKILGVVDFDKLELHNLQRQILHKESYLGKSKVESGWNFLQNLNSSLKIEKHDTKLTKQNAEQIVSKYDLILDCSDSIEARYVISTVCKKLNKDMILASVLKWEGQIFILPKNGPCYRCLFPQVKTNIMNCDEAGVVGTVCGIIGSIQATEALKLLLSDQKPTLIVFDAFNNEFKKFDLSLGLKKECQKEHTQFLIQKQHKTDLNEENKITWDIVLNKREEFNIIDIRSKTLFDLAHLEDTCNLEANYIYKNPMNLVKYDRKVVFLCKKGVSAKKLSGFCNRINIITYYIAGGLMEYKKNIDATFPIF